MGMAKCGDCFHYPVCQQFVDEDESFPEMKKGCPAFKNKADYPRVVRCRDCKYWGEIEDTFGGGYCSHQCWFVLDAEPPIVNHSDFCSYGERREGE